MRKYKRILFVCLATLLIAGLSFPEDKDFTLIPNKSPNELRILKLLVVADQAYRKQIPDWQDEITNFVNLASDIFYKQAGIKLEIKGLRPWQRDSIRKSNYANTNDLLNELIEDFRTKVSDFEILLVLTSHDLDDYEAWYKKNIILIRNKKMLTTYDRYGDIKMTEYPVMSAKERDERYVSIILHEVGHFFGCDHCQDNTCAMTPESVYPEKFCEKCIQIIKKWKWRELSNPQSERK